MARLNMTLDDATFQAVSQDARRRGIPTAKHARDLIREAMSRRAEMERKRRWAEAYQADRADARKLAAEMAPGALEVMGDEED